MRRLHFGSVVVIALAFGACDNTPTFMKGSRTLETQPPTMEGQEGFTPDTELFVLPIRRPTPKEMQKLVDKQTALGLMMPLPWVTRDDIQIEIQYSVKNLEDHEVTAFVRLNGGNEFGDYQPALYIDLSVPPRDRVTPPDLSGGSPIVLKPNEVFGGTFREDQVFEAGIDIEGIIRYPADMMNLFSAPFVVIERRSYVDKTGLEMIPAKEPIPAMVRYQIQLDADGHVALDYIVRARTVTTENLLRPDEPDKTTLYVPTDPAMPPPVMPPVFMTPMPPAGG